MTAEDVPWLTDVVRSGKLTPEDGSGMTPCRQRSILILAVLAGILAGGEPGAQGDVTILDRVSTVGSAVSLVVQTSKLFMADGGRLVDVFLEQESLGRIMTGGDGYGYLRLVPQCAGLMKISARSGDSEAEGRLLVMEKNERAVLIDLESALMDLHLRGRDRETCRSALEAIGRRYRLIYVYRFIGSGFSRARLEEVGFPPSVVLSWKGRATLESLREREVQVHAVIGSAQTVTDAGSQVPQRFSFEKAKGAQTVSEWEEIAKALD